MVVSVPDECVRLLCEMRRVWRWGVRLKEERSLIWLCERFIVVRCFHSLQIISIE